MTAATQTDPAAQDNPDGGRIDRLTAVLSAGRWPDFAALIRDAAEHGYRPTFRIDLDRRFRVLAEAFDAEMRAAGSDLRAERWEG